MRRAFVSCLSIALGIAGFSPPAAQSNGQLPAHFSIVRVDVERELVVVRNEGQTRGNLGNWLILSLRKDGRLQQLFRFPALCLVDPGVEVQVHSGSDAWDLRNRNDLCWPWQRRSTIHLYWDVSGNQPGVWIRGDRACLVDARRVLQDVWVAPPDPPEEAQKQCNRVLTAAHGS